MPKKNTDKIYKRIQRLEVILSLCLMLTPAFLMLATWEIRPSISDYAYSTSNNLFSGLLWISATLFLYNGMYNDKWYNFVLAISLIGVSLTPHKDYAILHYLFAAVFFIGSMIVMVAYSSNKQRLYKILAALFMLLALVSNLFLSLFSLFVAEWICLLPISIHFIGESLNKID